MRSLQVAAVQPRAGAWRPAAARRTGRCGRCAAAPAHGAAAESASPALPAAELVRRARQLYEDAWSKGDVRLLDRIMAEDHVQRDVIWQPENAGGGRRRLKRGILAYRSAYPDIKFTVEHAAAVEGERRVFVSWRAAGTNLGPIRDQPPSGRPVAFSGVTLVSFDEEGRIAESDVYRQAPEDEARYFTSAAAAAAAAPAPAAAPPQEGGGAAAAAGAPAAAAEQQQRHERQ